MLCLFFIIAFNRVAAQDEPDKKNVRIVHNEKINNQDRVDISLELVKQIGSEDGDDNNTFFLPLDVAVDKEGNILVLDTGNFRVQIFNKDGEFVRSIGRKGQGPGEFSSHPTHIDVDEEDNILIVTSGGRILTRLSKEGNHLNRFTNKIKCDNYTLLSLNKVIGSYFPDDIVIPANRPIPDEKQCNYVFGIFDIEGKVLGEYGELKEYDNELLNRRGNLCYLALDNSGNIYISFAYQNRIEKYSPTGSLMLYIDRKLGYEIATKIVKEKARSTPTILQIPTITPVSAGISIDHLNRIWVATYIKQDKQSFVDKYKNMVFEIFNSDGILISTIPVPHYFATFKIFNDRLYMVNSKVTSSIFEYKIK